MSIVTFCQQDNLESTKMMIGKGANVHEKDPYGYTCIMWACWNGFLEMAKYLHENGANILEKYYDGTTCMTWVCKCGNLEMAEFLVEKGEIIDTTHIQNATIGGHLELLKWLLKKDKRWEMLYFEQNEDALMAMELACDCGYLSIVEWLIEEGIKIREWDYETPELPETDVLIQTFSEDYSYLMLASGRNHLELAKFLHKIGADIKQKNCFGKTSIMYACEYGSIDVAKWLVSNDANIEEVTESGLSCMKLALEGKHFDVMEWLLDVNENVINELNWKDDTFMNLACERNDIEVAKWLLEKKPDFLEIKNGSGKSCMISACESGCIDVVKWLVEKGICVKSGHMDYYRPFLYACRAHQLYMCQWLILNGGLTGAMKHTQSGLKWVEEGTFENVVKYNTKHFRITDDLILWAQRVIAINHTFLHVVLRSNVILPNSYQQKNPSKRCHLPRLPRDIYERVALMVGVEKGIRLRYVREFLSCLN